MLRGGSERKNFAAESSAASRTRRKSQKCKAVRSGKDLISHLKQMAQMSGIFIPTSVLFWGGESSCMSVHL